MIAMWIDASPADFTLQIVIHMKAGSWLDIDRGLCSSILKRSLLSAKPNS
jgi:hypothetical protein